MVDKKFWQGKKVFITGHTGFKGGWMSVWLNHLQANVKGYSLNPDSKVNFFEVVGVGFKACGLIFVACFF